MEVRNKSRAASSRDETATDEPPGEENVLSDDHRIEISMEQNTISNSNDSINEEEGINPEKPNDAEQAGLLVQPESGPIDDDRVLRKIRGPRYFDPPESGNWLEWDTCYKNNYVRKKQKRGKACYICGDTRHKGRRCRKARICTMCDKIGHLAMECPNKDAGGEGGEPQLCLKCGNSGHTMFMCTNNYDPEDLKAIQCYICKEFGHLGCGISNTGALPKATCYNCGESGHLGQDCSRSLGQSVKEILAARNEATSKKKKKKREGGKKKKIKKETPTFVDSHNMSHTPPGPPILPTPQPVLSYARPRANVWLSPQSVAPRNLYPDPKLEGAPQHQPINYSSGTTQILNHRVPVHQFPRFPLHQGNYVMVRIHGDEAQIPGNSSTLPHLSNITWASQNGRQPHSRVEYLGIQNSYRLPYPRPPLSHQNIATHPVPRTYNTLPPSNYQTRTNLSHQIINPQPIPMFPHQISNRPVFPNQIINRRPLLPNQIGNSEAGNPGSG